jgi:hypothetical protein
MKTGCNNIVISTLIYQSQSQSYCQVYWGTRDEMTGSSSDDWIL